MNYLNRMYGRTQTPALEKSLDKNPNRVTGGLKGQGVDVFTMLGEDGSTKEIPTIAYVRSLEEQLKKQKAVIDVLERKLSRQGKSLESLDSYVRTKML